MARRDLSPSAADGAVVNFADLQDEYARPASPRSRPGYQSNGNWNARGSGSGHHGILRFLAFTGVMVVIVGVILLTVLRPLLAGAVIGWASDNPSALSVPLVADLVREDLGPSLTNAPSADSTEVPFVIATGDTTRILGQKLETGGLVIDSRAFVFEAYQEKVAGTWTAGNYVLRKNMTPAEVVSTLQAGPPPDPLITIGLREGLRIEQITAKLQTLTVGKPALQMDPEDFYNLAKHPPDELLASYPWLHLPAGASLDGFLGAATYRVKPDITAEAFVRMLLDHFYEAVGPDRINVPKARGLSFYQVVTLASLVEQEAALDSERRLIAGVFTNRLNPKKFPLGMLQSDITIFYINDSIQLAKIPVPKWVNYLFWGPVKGQLAGVTLPPDLEGYDTYTNKGLMRGPIDTPSLSSIDAALNPDTKAGYLFFVAKNDGSGTSAFAKTQADHEKNLKKYGYTK